MKLARLTPILISAYPHVGKQAKQRGIPFLEKPFSIDQVFTLLDQKKSIQSTSIKTRRNSGSDKHTTPPTLLDDLIKFFRAEPP